MGLPHALDHNDGTVCDLENRGWYRNILLPDRCSKDSAELRAEDREQKRSLEALATWNRALNEYSRLPLESEDPARDRLVAISGVAESLSEPIGSQYIAGLWGGGDAYHFAEQLLWRRVTKHYGKSLSNDHTTELVGSAPSWAWASISGAGEHNNYRWSYASRKGEFDVVIDILEAKAELVDESCPEER